MRGNEREKEIEIKKKFTEISHCLRTFLVSDADRHRETRKDTAVYTEIYG